MDVDRLAQRTLDKWLESRPDVDRDTAFAFFEGCKTGLGIGFEEGMLWERQFPHSTTVEKFQCP